MGEGGSGPVGPEKGIRSERGKGVRMGLDGWWI